LPGEALDQPVGDALDLLLQRIHAAQREGLVYEPTVAMVLWRISGEHRVHDGVALLGQLPDLRGHPIASAAHGGRKAAGEDLVVLHRLRDQGVARDHVEPRRRMPIDGRLLAELPVVVPGVGHHGRVEGIDVIQGAGHGAPLRAVRL